MCRALQSSLSDGDVSYHESCKPVNAGSRLPWRIAVENVCERISSDSYQWKFMESDAARAGGTTASGANNSKGLTLRKWTVLWNDSINSIVVNTQRWSLNLRTYLGGNARLQSIIRVRCWVDKAVALSRCIRFPCWRSREEEGKDINSSGLSTQVDKENQKDEHSKEAPSEARGFRREAIITRWRGKGGGGGGEVAE